ncbi:receptor kinase-like protein Xa21 [Pistacia vera]|uniref:receptor kinase-like protein Xa21 n=1 Tax=Pistacia vera TaxID=55513 RepID=UPI0012638BB4|nr:receptor kinase-like protein Xa21 [Pistacia vera]
MNDLNGSIPTVGRLPNLQALSLRNNNLQGSVPYKLCNIPVTLGHIETLETLSLAHNKFDGPIPTTFGTLISLVSLDLSNNSLSSEIPKSVESLSYRKNFNVLLNRCRYKRKNSPIDEVDLLPLAKWKRTSYLEIQQATDDFSECNLLGTGSFGTIFKGMLSGGTNVAIKVFNLQVEQVLRSFDSECEVLRNIRHQNLIKILSSCSNIDFKALILEFMPTGSFEKWLYSHNYCLDMLQGLNIMIDVASALEYLHHGYSTPIIHCDLKPNNILLDEDMVAHVSDFGIAKLLNDGDSKTRTTTLATIGYMAPDKNPFDAKVNCMLSIMDLALKCSMESPEQRINMKDALAKLKKIKFQFQKDVLGT